MASCHRTTLVGQGPLSPCQPHHLKTPKRTCPGKSTRSLENLGGARISDIINYRLGRGGSPTPAFAPPRNFRGHGRGGDSTGLRGPGPDHRVGRGRGRGAPGSPAGACSTDPFGLRMAMVSSPCCGWGDHTVALGGGGGRSLPLRATPPPSHIPTPANPVVAPPACLSELGSPWRWPLSLFY